MGVDTLWAKRLSEVPDAARGLIAAANPGTSADSVSIQVSTDLGGDLQRETQAAIEAVLEVRRAQTRAATAYRKMAHRLKDNGITGVDIAKILGVSPQRVSQLMKETSDNAS
ncbi:hypothetical protein ACFWGI_32490 [Streptomyces niveus]|uniref:hypothetical protein n=1 Tax=Streptomyces niveus TaxID=193462 RepID=UPI0036584EE1